MTSAIDIQIRTSYEKGLLHLDPEERIAFIAEECKFQVEAVKAKLIQISSVYRKDCGTEAEDRNGVNFNKNEAERMKEIMVMCAEEATYPDGSIDYKTRLKAAETVFDDFKGRKDTIKAIQNGPTFNILNLNESIQRARVMAQATRAALPVNTRDSVVEAEVTSSE